MDDFQPSVGPDLIPSLKWADHYKYLGFQMGRERLGSPNGLGEELLKDVDTISNSLLTDWQKIEAINMFVLSKASYHLNAASLDKTWVTKTDAAIRRIAEDGVVKRR